MDIGIVIGNIFSTIKHSAYQNCKLLLVENVDMHLKRTSAAFVAVDSVDAGVGDVVLIANEGKTASDILQGKQLPVRSVIIGVIDKIRLNTESQMQ